jgi:hypothetical protein
MNIEEFEAFYSKFKENREFINMGNNMKILNDNVGDLLELSKVFRSAIDCWYVNGSVPQEVIIKGEQILNNIPDIEEDDF